MTFRHCLPVASVLLAPAALSAQSTESTQSAVASIVPADILRQIGIIADDSMRGRATPSPELEKTATYIAAEFRRFGLKPGGDGGSFIQHYALQWIDIDTAGSSVSVSGGPTLRFGPDVLPGREPREAEVSGRVIVLSGGSPDPAALPRLPLAGSVVMILLPADDPMGRNNGLVRNMGVIGAQRPAAILLVSGLAEAAWRQTADAVLRPRVSPAWWEARPGPPRAPVLLVREASLRPTLERRGTAFAGLQSATSGPVRATPVDLTVALTLKSKVDRGSGAPNVVGILEGSDPVLKDEYLVFSGHMDHLGVGQPDARGDSIYNGADDDASGTIAVVELAMAFAKLEPKPKRSLIFLTVSGEERGLWGSDYFANHPPVPIGQIVADLNTDMVGRNWKDTIVVIGKEHSDLGATLNRVNRAHPELRMTAIDDIWPNEDFYSRSDHFNFARKGVPILFFFNGTHADYHRPSDEVSKIDAEKESRIVKLAFYLGLDLANAKDRPKWKPDSYKRVVEPAGR